MNSINITELSVKAASGAVIVHIALHGALTVERYQFLEEALQGFIDKHRRIRLLLVLEEFEGLTSSAMYRDLLTEQKLGPRLERTALVIDYSPDAPARSAETPLTDGNTRWFKPEQTDKAIQWLIDDAV
jgi:hypothetical protein